MLGLSSTIATAVSRDVRHYNNWSVDFDGTDDVVNFGSVHNLGDSTDFTISLWFKKDNTGAHYLLGKEESADDRWRLYIGSDEEINFTAPEGIPFDATTPIQNGWYDHDIVKSFLDKITTKYGKGTLNPETGVFTAEKS